MKHLAIILLAVAASACQNQSTVFSWYHPLGGEYLFEFDQRECQTLVAEQGLRLGSDLEGPFFNCMQQRGYTLLTAGVFDQATIFADLTSGGR